jgi:hypothetical protein
MAEVEEPYSFPAEFQAVFIPKQKPAPAPVSDSMRTFVASYPPLSQVTELDDGAVAFTALLEVHESRGAEPWQAALWHSIDDGEWTEAPLNTVEANQGPVFLHDPPSHIARFYFKASVSVQKSMRFTVKVRGGSHEDWRWIRDEQGLGDGVVIVKPGASGAVVSPDTLGDLIKDLNPAWKIGSIMSQSPGTNLWSLTADIPAADGGNSSYADIPVGIPWGSFLRCVRLRHGPSPCRAICCYNLTCRLLTDELDGLRWCAYGALGSLLDMERTPSRSTRTASSARS